MGTLRFFRCVGPSATLLYRAAASGARDAERTTACDATRISSAARGAIRAQPPTGASGARDAESEHIGMPCETRALSGQRVERMLARAAAVGDRMLKHASRRFI